MHTLVGAFAGLIAVVVVGTMFITAEYRRGLIRTTLAASPRRGRVLAAKAIVIGSVTFVAGLAAAVVAVPLGSRLLRDNGNYLYPVTALTEVRMVAGTAAMLAVAAVLALAIGAVLRRSAIAVTVVIVAIVLPYLISVTNLPARGRRRGCCGSPRPPPSRSSRPSRTTRRSSNVCSAGEWLLPAGAMGRFRGAVRVGRGRAGPGRVPAAPEGRMSLALGCGTSAHPARAIHGRGRPAGRAARRVDQAAHRAGHGLAAGRRRRADRGGQRGRGRGHPVPGRGLRPGSRPRSA